MAPEQPCPHDKVQAGAKRFTWSGSQQLRAVPSCYACPLACRFFNRACSWINEVYAANGVQLEWKLAPLSGDNLVPDFVFGPREAHGKAEVMAAEGKVRSPCMCLWVAFSADAPWCACVCQQT